jgi:hypothetical protein
MQGAELQNPLRQPAVRYESRGVTFAARGVQDRHYPTGYLGNNVDDLSHAVPAPDAKIQEQLIGTLREHIENLDVSLSEIAHMDIISNASAISRRIVSSKYFESVGQSTSRPDGPWD